MKTLTSVNWYSPLYEKLTNIRTARFLRTHTDAEIKLYLLLHPELHLYTIIDNEPMPTPADEQQVAAGVVSRRHITERQRVKQQEQPYIDEFGRYVYLTSRIGTSADIDLRYDEEPEPELFTLEYIEDDRATSNAYVQRS